MQPPSTSTVVPFCDGVTPPKLNFAALALIYHRNHVDPSQIDGIFQTQLKTTEEKIEAFGDILAKLAPDELLIFLGGMDVHLRSELTNLYVSSNPQSMAGVLIQVVSSSLSSPDKNQIYTLLLNDLGQGPTLLLAPFISNLPPVILYESLTLLSNANLIKDCLSDLAQRQNRTEIYAQLLRGIAAFVPKEMATMPPVWDLIMDIIPDNLQDSDSWETKVFIKSLNPNAKGSLLYDMGKDWHVVKCIFWKASPALRHAIVEAYADEPRNLATWLIGALQLESNFRSRCALIRSTLQFLDRDQRRNLLEMIATNDPKDTVNYLLCALPDPVFEQHISLVKDFMQHCRVFPSTHFSEIMQKIKDIKRHIYVLTKLEFEIIQKRYPVDEDGKVEEVKDIRSLTMHQLRIEGLQLLQDENEQTRARSLMSLLESVPPLLLAIGMLDEEFSKFLTDCLPYLTGNQLSLIAKLIATSTDQSV